ncbi:hypothetical protein [Micromonospora sp. NPDC048830]|uniref:hypothetical protein n=1 Tax=Micromonospora sp. NPDC048830 TaxID=3364257 RepID=UPI0037112A71
MAGPAPGFAGTSAAGFAPGADRPGPPVPDDLALLVAGFTATVTDPAAEPVVDGRELAQASWFPLDALPAELPPAYSISRWLIDHLAVPHPGS